jgi:hypothetical protein
MNPDTVKKFGDELRSFSFLYINNLLYAALSILFGVCIIFNQIMPSATTIIPATPVLLVTGVVAVVLGLFWIWFTVKSTKGMREVRATFEKKKAALTPEEITRLMIRMITRYREQKTMIRTMFIISLLYAACPLVLGVSNILPGEPAQSVPIPLVIASVLFFAVAAQWIAASLAFWRYTNVWDARLEALARSEEELDRILEQG